MECKCQQCGMEVIGMKCGKCQEELVNAIIVGKDGTEIQVAKCPNGCGMIKSPTCCGRDMVCSAA